MLDMKKMSTQHTKHIQYAQYTLHTQKNKSIYHEAIRNVFIAMALFASSITLVHAESRTLSNLERERSSLMGIIVQEEISPIERERKIALSQRRLMDMERMVIRDDRLLGSHDPMVKKAFDHYETTFLVHASVEANQHIVDFWLQQLNLDSQSVLESKRGRR